MDFITTDHVKSVSLGAVQQINLDTIQCEREYFFFTFVLYVNNYYYEGN